MVEFLAMEEQDVLSLMAIFKEMDEDNLEKVREILNTWWNAEDIPMEMLRARVAFIFKKGDTSKFEN